LGRGWHWGTPEGPANPDHRVILQASALSSVPPPRTFSNSPSSTTTPRFWRTQATVPPPPSLAETPWDAPHPSGCSFPSPGGCTTLPKTVSGMFLTVCRGICYEEVRVRHDEPNVPYIPDFFSPTRFQTFKPALSRLLNEARENTKPRSTPQVFGNVHGSPQVRPQENLKNLL